MMKKPRILLVDDEPDNRDMLSRRLQRSGFDIALAENGQQALEQMNRDTFDLILLDSMMPGMNGLDVLKLVRALHSAEELPVIMVTAITQGEHIVEALGHGANDYVTKPIDFPVALARIHSQLARRAADLALRRSEQRYALVARGSNACLWDWDLESQRIFYSDRWKSLLGIAPEKELSTVVEEWFSRVDPRDLPALEAALREHWATAAAQTFETEFRIRRGNGSYAWVRCSAATVRDADGLAVRMAGSLSDNHGAKIKDELTGIANRLLFVDRLETTLAAIPKSLTAALFIDVDRFKLVNDSWGHAVGDLLLCAIAERLTNGVRAEVSITRPRSRDLVARLGGDEFGVLLTDLSSPEEALAIAERLLARFQAPFVLGDRVINSSLSVGIAWQGTSAAELLRDADTAMYAGKAAGRGRVAMFTEDLRQRVLDRAQIEGDLAEAIRSGQITVHYQPIVRMSDRKIAGFEALARWNHPTRGNIPPTEFIPVAEETGLIRSLGLDILREACRQMRHWQARFPQAPPLDMAVNVSVVQLREASFVDHILEILQETGIAPTALKLEVTENFLLDEEDGVVDCLKKLRQLGIRLQIDDFGTGYSNLSRLGMLPFDGLKIDKALTDQLGGEASLVGSIIGMVKNLGMGVVVEGVEDCAQVDELDRAGCEYAQGYFFARPVGPAEAEALIQLQADGAEHPALIPSA